MTDIIINNELKMSCPEGFREMTRDEIHQQFGQTTEDQTGIRNESGSVYINVMYHRFNALIGAMISNKGLAQDRENRLKKIYKDKMYRSSELFHREIAGHEAYGFSYEFVLNDISMYAECILFKTKNTTYTVYYYTRKENNEQNHPALDEVCSSMAFQK